MNRKIAFSLVIGLIFSFIIAYFTSEQIDTYSTHVYKPNTRGGVKTRSLDKTEKVYHPTLIIISFLGGFGVGYLLADKIKL